MQIPYGDLALGQDLPIPSALLEYGFLVFSEQLLQFAEIVSIVKPLLLLFMHCLFPFDRLNEI